MSVVPIQNRISGLFASRLSPIDPINSLIPPDAATNPANLAKLRQQLGFKQAQANTLEIIDGKLTGKVLGDIVDGAAKAAYLDAACNLLGCTKANAITMGDGANDLIMMNGSGISVAYQAKPLVKEKADAAFDRVGLDAALLLIS